MREHSISNRVWSWSQIPLTHLPAIADLPNAWTGINKGNPLNPPILPIHQIHQIHQLHLHWPRLVSWALQSLAPVGHPTPQWKTSVDGLDGVDGVRGGPRAIPQDSPGPDRFSQSHQPVVMWTWHCWDSLIFTDLIEMGDGSGAKFTIEQSSNDPPDLYFLPPEFNGETPPANSPSSYSLVHCEPGLEGSCWRHQPSRSSALRASIDTSHEGWFDSKRPETAGV